MNFLVICIDTLRWDHLGFNNQRWMGSPKPILTPNIDAFARRATIFDRCHINSFPTVPHRMDCFTGQCNFPRFDWQTLPDSLVSLPEAMNHAGYYTATVADTTNFIKANITRGMQEIQVTYQPPADAPKPEEIPFPVPQENIRQKGIQRQRQLADMAHFRHESDWWAARTMTCAADWLQDNAARPGHPGRDKWLLWVDTFEVHEVWHTPQYYIDLYDPHYEGLDYDFPRYGAADIYSRKELRHLWAHYAAEVTLTDRWIGHLFDQLTMMGLWDTTMVILTSDHGMYIGEHGRAGKHTVAGDADPWPLYQEVAHVPLVVWTPGGGNCHRVASLVQPADLMPTICDAAGAACPAVHGHSLLPLIARDRMSQCRVVYSAKHNSSTKRLSLCPTWLTATTENMTFLAAEQGAQVFHAPELYDLRTDPGQQRNLAAKEPELCKRMQNAAIRFLRDQGAEEAVVARFEGLL